MGFRITTLMIEFLGILAAVTLSISGIPQAIKAYRDGNAVGVSLTMVLLVLFGIAATAAYIFGKHGIDLILHIQYAIQFVIWGIVLRYRLYPRRKNALRKTKPKRAIRIHR